MSWFLAVLRQYATFRGRARRREYWMYLLVYLGIYLLLMLVDALTGTFEMESESGLLSGLFMLGTLLPSIAVAVRRLHDTDRSGWWLLLGLIPLVGQIVLLYFLIQEGDEGSNVFGSDPKAAERA
jgi:uncharacterized membrane protein YhaH (DUF805 family)